MSGRLAIRTISPFNLATTSLGMPAGPTTPYQAIDSNPGTPDSATVEICGNTGERAELVTARPRNLADFTCGRIGIMLSNANKTCPPIRSTIAGPLPLYGICVISTLVMNLNISAVRCCGEPGPADA